jgi:DNA replication protein DnaC
MSGKFNLGHRADGLVGFASKSAHRKPTLADAISERIVHDSHSIVISGEISMRERKGLSTKTS